MPLRDGGQVSPSSKHSPYRAAPGNTTPVSSCCTVSDFQPSAVWYFGPKNVAYSDSPGRSSVRTRFLMSCTKLVLPDGRPSKAPLRTEAKAPEPCTPLPSDRSVTRKTAREGATSSGGASSPAGPAAVDDRQHYTLASDVELPAIIDADRSPRS